MFRPIAKAYVLLGLFALPTVVLADGVPGSESNSTPAPPGATQGVFLPLLVAPGASNKAAAATVVHCTNLAATGTHLMVEFLNFDAAVACTINSLAIGSFATWTAATQGVALFFEDAVCSAPGTIEQGVVRVSVAAGFSADVACTVQVIDPAGTTPAYATNLEVYPR